MKILLFFLVVYCTSNSLFGKASASRPNIIFLFADDQRADTIAALGNPIIKTPNLDRLVHRGLSFDCAYMQGGLNAATCIPSRAMLLAGQNLFRIDEKLLRDHTYPEAFGQCGYSTLLIGKWHNGDESLPRCFQMARSVFLNGMGNPLNETLYTLIDGKLGDPHVTRKHACEIFADDAVEFLKKPHASPFFVYLAFDAPHDPHILPADYPLFYDSNKIPLPPNFLPQHPWDNGEMTIRDELLLPWPRTPEKTRALIAEYYRYISYLDSQIGRVLDALDSSSYAQNTIVVFSADSGVARGSHGLIGKQNCYEHSLRVPLIVAGPEIPVNRRTNAMCYTYDILPTLAKLCDVQGPSTSEGRDLSAVFADPDRPARSELFFAYKNVQRAVRDRRWKLIRYPLVDKTQLFDLKSDPQETRNLADSPDQAANIARLTSMMERLQKESGDTAPLRVAKPLPAEWSPPILNKT